MNVEKKKRELVHMEGSGKNVKDRKRNENVCVCKTRRIISLLTAELKSGKEKVLMVIFFMQKTFFIRFIFESIHSNV